MKHEIQSGVLTIYLIGQVDSSNAGEIEKDIFKIIEKTSPSDLIMDAEKLEYISSAGLRIILKLRRRFSGMRLINVSSSVYEILEMTGFTEMLTVEKAYRYFDVDGCQVIGAGANGTVYRIDSDTIVKVYRKATSLEEIKKEQELSHTAFIMGIPTAIPYDVVKVGDLYGSVFELLNAKSLDELMIEDASNADFVADQTAEIARSIHATEAPPNLPSQKEVALKWVSVVQPYFSKAMFAKLKKLVEDIPETDTMIHGDLHIKNIMLQNGEALLIDMDTLSCGHPIFELAFIFNAYKGFGVADPSEIERFLGLPIDICHRIWQRILERYLDTDDNDRIAAIEEKAAIIGYLRIMRRVIRMGRQDTPDGNRLVCACRERLCAYLPLVDTLTF